MALEDDEPYDLICLDVMMPVLDANKIFINSVSFLIGL